jgi:protein-S-isoprenylcysteine O-methyltransferase Ste14
LADSLRRTFEEIAEEESADRWLPIVSGIMFLADIVICALDIVVLRHGSYRVTVVGITGIALFVAGLGLYEVARRTLGEFFSEAVRVASGHKLITSGPYCTVRHPIYLGEILFASLSP